jgi:hypothetical protein
MSSVAGRLEFGGATLYRRRALPALKVSIKWLYARRGRKF